MTLRESPLVSTAWLFEHIEAPDIRVADASWYLPQARRDARAEYAAAHIPGSVFFDIDELSDENSELPHMLASPAKFASRMRKLGLGDGNLVVLYDGAGLYSAPRAWWMLRAMGHEDVVVLDGGFPKWKRDHGPLEDLFPELTPRHFTPRVNYALIRDFRQMRNNRETPRESVVDFRSAPRFAGREKEPRAGVRPGHIPGSVNLPYTELVSTDGTLKQRDVLERLFSEAGVDVARPIVTTCGSGITAAIGALALAAIGAHDVALYDGSWAEWGTRSEAPVETA
ncbi:MAG TPA: 3-mercaptopyruvate sulfurtransferase [Rhizomicrobium sp.]|jgi:thiosulfate/3-mercaptopyruvate sulfurtransferase